MRKKNLFSLLAVPLVTVMLITGCAAGAPNDNTPSPNPPSSSSQPANPTPTDGPTIPGESPSAPQEVTSGATIGADTAAELNADRKGDMMAYAMPDGTYVAMPRRGEVPPVVQGVVNSKTEAVAPTLPTTMGSGAGSIRAEAVSAYTSQVVQETGRTPILVMPEAAYWSAADSDSGNVTVRYSITNGPQSLRNVSVEGLSGYATKEEAVAAAQAWLDSLGDAASRFILAVG